MSGLFFKDVVQAVLLFGVETWVITPRMVKALGGFQTQVVRRLTVRLPVEDTIKEVEIHLGGGGKGGGGILGDGGVYQAAKEHSFTLHRYVITV